MALYMYSHPARIIPRICGVWQRVLIPIEINSCCSMFVHRKFAITVCTIITHDVMTDWNATAVLLQKNYGVTGLVAVQVFYLRLFGCQMRFKGGERAGHSED